MTRRLPVMLCALVFAAACHDSPDNGAPDPCQESDAQACVGAARLEVAFCKNVSIEATPARTYVGRLVSLNARTDRAPAELTASWSAEPDGAFVDSEAGATNYKCTSVGTKKLSVRASDERGCSSQSQVEVHCLAAP